NKIFVLNQRPACPGVRHFCLGHNREPAQARRPFGCAHRCVLGARVLVAMWSVAQPPHPRAASDLSTFLEPVDRSTRAARRTIAIATPIRTAFQNSRGRLPVHMPLLSSDFPR